MKNHYLLRRSSFVPLLVIAFSIFLLVFAGVVFAQEPTVEPVLTVTPAPSGVDQILDVIFSGELPDSATGAVGVLISVVLALIALPNLTQVFTDALKKIDFKTLAGGIFSGLFSDSDKAHVGGLLAELASFIIAAIMTFAANSFVYPLAGKIDEMGFWMVVAAIWGVARKIYRDRSQAKSK